MGSSYRVCCCFTRSFWTAELQPPDDVKELFEKYAGVAAAYMTAEQFRHFLAAEQVATTDDPPEKIVENVLKERHHIAKFTRNTLSLDDFFHYLFSIDLNPPFQSKVHQDMTAPLSHYFIFTGHNSYLTGNQLSSASSDIPIIAALKRGVRVIELDLWPGSSKDCLQLALPRPIRSGTHTGKWCCCCCSSKDEIQVVHGRTLTAPVDLMTCLKSIKKYAFFSSDYPVIITLEDHLTPKLQDKAKEMITQTFDGMLYYPESDNLKEFPSPEELKRRILISTKPPKEFLEAEEPVRGKDTDHERPLQRLKFLLQNDSHEDEQDTVDPIDYDGGDISQHFEPLTYKRLIAIHQRKKSKLEDALEIDPEKVCRVSFSEQKLEKAATSHGKDLIRFTQKNILRIYPKGTRFNSSNYNPFVSWMHGAQMVAFNMQGHGRSLWQMHGMFRGNGGCGYVKKPNFLMDKDHVFDPRAKLPVKTTLKVKVYMSDGWRMDFKKTHFDKCSPPDFYTKVGIAGVRADETTMHETRVKVDQWIPVWNEEFSFPLTLPELALLNIQVNERDNDKKDDFGGQTCLPVSELKQGIRAIPLYSYKGEIFKSVKLLMCFKFV